MGISWSGRRRNNYYQNPPPLPPAPPPPPPPPPPPQYLSSSSSSSNYYAPDSPPLPSPARPHAYVFANTCAPYPAPHNLYASHPPPPAHTHYYSGGGYVGHGVPNHANSVMGRFGYHHHPYYANQPSTGGWPPAFRPPHMGQHHQQPFIAPPPYVEHQNAKKVRNDVNVHKDTLRIEVDEQNPDQHLVSFVFDALYDGSITIFYFAREEPNCKFVPLYPDAFMPVKIPFQKGLGQKFRQPSGTGIDLGFFDLDDLAKPSPGEDVYPLVISAKTSSPPCLDEHIGETMQDTSPHMQITQAVLEKNIGDPFQVRVIRQILWIDGVRYELREIFGIGRSAVEGFDDNDPGKECVICMTEPKDTAVLPCRHMCMCRECAQELRLQSNKCPICRQPIEELLEIKINSGNK